MMIKRFLRRQFQFSNLDNSMFVFIFFIVLILGLLVYSHNTQLKIVALSKEVKAANDLKLKFIRFSEQNYHTQLELTEYVFSPSIELLRRFLLEREEFLLLNEDIQNSFTDHLHHDDNVIHESFKEVRSVIPQLLDKWEQVVQLIRSHADTEEIKRAMQELDDFTDGTQLNRKISLLIDHQSEHVAEDERDIENLQSSRMLVSGLMVAFFLSIVMAVLHQSSIRVRNEKLKVVQSNKLASLGEMSAGVAHELNNPLTLIEGFNGRIKAGLRKKNFPEDSALFDYVQEVEEGVNRMKKIIHHFRDFSRQSNQTLSNSFINPIVERSFILLTEQLKLKDIQIEIILCEENPIASVDPIRLEQVFFNLLSNARDAIESKENRQEQEMKITAQTWTDDESVIIEFRDTGSGITNQDIERIFDPFFTTKPVGKGTGLGLSISQGIIRDFGGRIEVSSRNGYGASFRVTLPLAVSASKNKAA